VSNSQYFQFTLGPVQGFVSQARRTRDFWAGSFILSWLAGVAMHAIRLQGGTVEFPTPNNNFMGWLTSDVDAYPVGDPAESTSPPLQGCIPNRFKALSSSVPEGFKGQLVDDAVRKAWETLAELIWKRDLKTVATPETRAIWDRQVKGFWEISWVISAKDDPSLLDQRKNSRIWMPPSESGNKCMIMEGWQELSGVEAPDMNRVNQFWSTVRHTEELKRDIREGEHLSALAFIKRRFVHYFEDIDRVPMPGFVSASFSGWALPAAVPSVAFIAASPWLAQVIRTADVAVFSRFNEAAKKVVDYGEIKADIRCVKEAAQARKADGFDRRWAGLDGNVYFEAALQNKNIFPDQDAAKKTLSALHDLRKSADVKGLPSPFYAILLMDGDQLGKHMGKRENQMPISTALNVFTQGVEQRVRDHDGFLVYAGGDDVLAILPLESAIAAANTLRLFYRECFSTHAPKIPSTLSGAIEFAHIRMPLTRVLQDAHALLDGVAKAEVGRNALAVRVWKPGGMTVQWAQPWDVATENEGTEVVLTRLLAAFGEEGSDASFTNKFFFRMEDILERFGSNDPADIEALLLAEYLHSGGSKLTANVAVFKDLVRQCIKFRRATAEDKEAKADGCSAQGAMLLRFLAQKGLGRD